MLKIPYGISNFERIRTQGYAYVDKTHFIEQVEYTTYPLHLRPRRFGKSLFVSMLESYYDLAHADKFDELFKGLYIHEFPTANKNNYYILRFNFSGIETRSVETVLEGFRVKVQLAVEKVISKYGLDINLEKSESPATILASFLSQFEELNLKQKIYILIDEYDHFTNAVLKEGLKGFMTLVTRGGTVRSFYEIIKEKTESGVVEKFFITGVMSVSLDSMTSGFNIPTKITNDSRFSDIMGFTSEEVKSLLDEKFINSKNETVVLTNDEQDDVYEILRQNYNGYMFAEEVETKVFNSTLIMYYLRHYIEEKKHPKKLVDHNLNQSGATIKTIVDIKNRDQNYELIEEIIENKKVYATLSESINVDIKYDRNDFITLLFSIGLLTIKESGFQTIFKMPNKVIESVYLEYLYEMVQKNNNYLIDVGIQQAALLEMGENGKIDEITNIVANFLSHTSGRNKINFDEKSIKLIYLMLLTATNQYIVYDEWPSRQGYTDLTVFKSPNSFAKHEYLIELKYIKISDTTADKIKSEFNKGAKQIAQYMQDNRMKNRPDLKKFVVVFSGFDVAKMEEIVI